MFVVREVPARVWPICGEDYPSWLLLGWWADKPLHVMAAYNAQDDEQIVIAAYEPDPVLWDDGFRRESNEMRSVQTGGDAPRRDHGDV